MGQKEVPTAFKFGFGGLSGCGAACVVQPMDLVKNRMQVTKLLLPGRFLRDGTGGTGPVFSRTLITNQS